MTSVTVNGRRYDVDLPDDTPLLWALRDEMGLTGTKFGCGMALCGACTVLVDGQPVRACQTPISAVGTSKITTVEGVGADRVGRVGRGREARGQDEAAHRGHPLDEPPPAHVGDDDRTVRRAFRPERAHRTAPRTACLMAWRIRT